MVQAFLHLQYYLNICIRRVNLFPDMYVVARGAEGGGIGFRA